MTQNEEKGNAHCNTFENSDATNGFLSAFSIFLALDKSTTNKESYWDPNKLMSNSYKKAVYT